MLLKTDLSKHRENIADFADQFAIKNFVLSEMTAFPLGQTFGESFIFEGFVLMICLKGEAVFKVNYREHTLVPNAAFIIFPRQVFSMSKRSEDLFLESMFLSSDYILQLPQPRNFDLLKTMSLDPVKKMKEEMLHNMLEFHSLIAKYHRGEDSPYKEEQVKAFVFALFLELAKAYTDSPKEIARTISRQEQLTDNFLTLLIKHYAEERSVAFYADKLCLTPKYLSMTIKKITGHSILDWIHEVVIIEIKKQLKTTDKTVLQISEEMNFPNPSFFSQYFKQHTGMAPLQYKKS